MVYKYLKMDHHNSRHVVTLVNSIIGVSILAMPYCFKQCGVVLALLMLLVSNLLTRVTCHFLIKSANIARRRTFEHLAFHTFGSLGKFGIEIGMIGFLIGTCVAFFVVMGDLGPEIISGITNTGTSSTMRTSILMALALFCVLPLGLLRNVDSLIGVSKATIGFYVCLVLKIILEALPHIYTGDWINKVELWKPSGILQVLPIFSMALSCQTQLFEIYQALEHPTLERMNHVTKSAINICTAVYFFVGFFGYVTFAETSFSGNILLSFAPSFVTNAMKLGFILSLAFSFPLVIFPCRQSLYSLLYREGHSLHESTSNYIPEGKFKSITLFIVFTSLVVAILIPTIEIVLGLVGSTIGVMICLIFPVACFIYISQKNTNERLVAKFVLTMSLFIMILGTYANLRSLEKIESTIVRLEMNTQPIIKLENIIVSELPPPKLKYNIPTVNKSTNSPEVRHEPPQPVELPEQSKAETKLSEDDIKDAKIREIESKLHVAKDILKVENTNEDKAHVKEIPDVPSIEKNPDGVNLSKTAGKIKSDGDEVDIEAIKKDDNEMKLQVKETKVNKLHEEEDHKIIIETLQKQNEFQENLVKQQQKLIEVIEKQQEIEKQQNMEKQEKKVNEEKLKAVKEIENIALKAIERISGGDKDVDKKVSDDLDHKVDEIIDKKKNDKEAVESDILQKNPIKEKSTHEEKNMTINNYKVNINEKDTNLGIAIGKAQATGINDKSSKPSESNNLKIVEETKQKLENIVKEVKDLNSQIKEDKNITIKNTTTLVGKMSEIANLDPAPLFINLGQKINDSVEHMEDKQANILKAIPIAVKVMNSSSYVTLNKSANHDGSLRHDVKHADTIEDEAKVLRREILSYAMIRRRR